MPDFDLSEFNMEDFKNKLNLLQTCLPINRPFDVAVYKECMSYFKQKYDATASEVLVIVSFLLSGNFYLSAFRIACITGLPMDVVLSSLNSLHSRNILKKHTGTNGYEPSQMLYSEIIDLHHSEDSEEEMEAYDFDDIEMHNILVNQFQENKSDSELGEYNRSICEIVGMIDGPIYKHPDLIFSAGCEYIGILERNDTEQLVFFFMCSHFLGNGSQTMDPKQFSPKNYRIDITNEEFSCALDSLASANLVEKVFTDSDRESEKSKYVYRLSLKAVKSLFRGTLDKLNYNELLQFGTVTLHSDIKSRILFFDEQTETKVHDLERVFSVSDYSRLTGIFEKNGLKPSVACLFYGAPGSGKTELAKQLARKTGRDIIIADISRLESMWMGASEKHYRAIFAAYKYLCAVSEHFPILVFNEADGIMARRLSNPSNYHESLGNRLQNLLLEELENFEGIFIATTNFAANLDDAFKRRFIHKIHFDRPDGATLRMMWKEKMPSLSSEHLDSLVSTFRFTGAQIDNVRKMILIRECALGQTVTMDDIVGFCEEEAMEFSTKDITSETKRIGF